MRYAIAIVCVALLLTACGGVTVTSATVLSAFTAAGLEASNPQPMTNADYGLAPKVCQGTRFLIPSLGEKSGGRLFICESATDRDALKTFYDTLGKSSAAFFSWTFVNGAILVQLNGELPEAQAKRYEAVIQSIK